MVGVGVLGSATPRLLLRSAVDRQFEIVGEARRVALQNHLELAANITDARASIAFRNQQIHAEERTFGQVVAQLRDLQTLLERTPAVQCAFEPVGVEEIVGLLS
jgi:hypothetical protein